MPQEISKEILDRVDTVGNKLAELAASLKVPAEQLFESLCVRMRIEGITTIMGSFLLLVICLAIIKVFYFYTKKHYDYLEEKYGAGYNNYTNSPYSWKADSCIAFFVCFLVVFLVSLFFFPSAFGKIFAPETYAVEFIMEQIK